MDDQRIKDKSVEKEPERTCVFGPVPSRRLGLSLGIDLVPLKTCSFDCLYCQVGKTNDLTIDIKPYINKVALFKQIERKLEKITPDAITFSGSGEPTLNSEIGEIIHFIKSITDTRIALLTNGSLLWRKEVREAISGADIVMPTLSTVKENTFRAIHWPHPELRLGRIVEGLKSFREIFKGDLYLEAIFLAGLNDSDEEIEMLMEAINGVSPDRVQINTVVRPPSDSRAGSITVNRLNEIKRKIGDFAEIIADAPFKQKNLVPEELNDAILNMAQRRPIRVSDIADALSVPVNDAKVCIKGMVVRGLLHPQKHSGEIYYSA